MMKNLYIARGAVLSLLAIFVLSAAGRGIDEEAARKKAEAFVKKQMGRAQGVKMRRVDGALPVAENAEEGRLASATEGNQPVYIFNCEGGGYVIVSGDERTFDILGYGYTGEIDPEAMPMNMKEWLGEYADAIARLDEGNVAPKWPSKARRAISPCIETRWNQGEPYNLTVPYCYFDYKGDTYYFQAVTGCTATAMAQMMYHFRYPEYVQATIPRYEGEYSMWYENSIVQTSFTSSYIPYGAALNWEFMLPSYEPGTYTDGEANSVARLMQYAGAAFNTVYGPESGATTMDVLCGVTNNFGYKDAYMVSSSSFDTYDEWVERVYEEIEASGVVCFSGRTVSDSGHMFLLDGYEGEDYFHVNWGWGGALDGYFKLALMDPGFEQGTGGGTEGYSEWQLFITGMGPNGNGLTRMEKRFECFEITGGKEGMSYKQNVWTKSVDIPNFSIVFGNATFAEVDLYAGVGVYNSTGNLIQTFQIGRVSATCYEAYISGSENTYISLSLPSDGNYTIKGISREKTTDEWKPMYGTDKNCICITVDKGNATIIPVGISVPTATTPQPTDNTWRTLDGRILPGKPTAPGIYIRGKEKVLVK